MFDRLAQTIGVEANTPAGRGRKETRSGYVRRGLLSRHSMMMGRWPKCRIISLRIPARLATGTAKPAHAGLVAIKLLLRGTKIRTQGNGRPRPAARSRRRYRKLVTDLIEKVKQRPDMEYFSLLEHCYGSEAVRGQLTGVITSENIEPADQQRLEQEFLQILDKLIDKCSRKIRTRELRSKLQAKAAANGHTDA